MVMDASCNPGQCECSISRADSSDIFGLYSNINSEKLICLNELEPDSGKKVFRAWDDREDQSKFVLSDVDEELLFNIPFTGVVKLKKICVIGLNDDSHPRTLKLFNVKEPMQFDDIRRLQAGQSIDLSVDVHGHFHYALKQTKFQNVSWLCAYFADNYGDDVTRINYIGLQGEYIRDYRDELAITNYELTANPSDHKLPFQNAVSHGIS